METILANVIAGVIIGVVLLFVERIIKLTIFQRKGWVLPSSPGAQSPPDDVTKNRIDEELPKEQSQPQQREVIEKEPEIVSSQLPVATTSELTVTVKPSRRAIIAALLSFIILGGGGQIYLGQRKKGIVIIIVVIAVAILESILGSFSLGLGTFVSILFAIDAYNLAKKLDSSEALGEWEFAVGKKAILLAVMASIIYFIIFLVVGVVVAIITSA